MTMPRVAENPDRIIPTLAPDDLLVDEVGPWALEKYRRLALYDTLFASGMKRRWDVRVYLDLFCGPGRAAIRGTGQLVETSPLIALRVPVRFDAYIFCDERPDAIAALRARSPRHSRGARHLSRRQLQRTARRDPCRDSQGLQGSHGIVAVCS